jgi:transforming growth factor-beta-induced protein
MISVENGMVFLNGTVQVIMTDIEASNGVIHVIDAVLLPPAD